jgi:hypothetical protein
MKSKARESWRRLFLWLAVLGCLLVARLAVGLDWDIDVVDDGKQFSWMTDRSLRLDAAGHSHIAYGGDHLYYAWDDGPAWQYEVADSSVGVGEDASLVLDGWGLPHISYYDRTNQDLKYAYRDASCWHIETVDAAGSVGFSTSMALDGSGYPHISYHDDTNSNLKYAYRDASGWHTETVDAAGDVGWHTSLALDGSGYPCISYFDWGNGDLKYARALGPTPMVLTGALSGGVLVLDWTTVPGAAGYWGYGEGNQAYVEPGFAPGYQHRLAVLSPTTHTWLSASGIGDPNANWTYLVLAVDAAEQELRRSNRIGEQDFGMTIDPSTPLGMGK